MPDSDKVYNEGARLLAHFPDWEMHLDRIINESWNTLLKYCVRNKQSQYSASVKLTFASDLIGKRIARDIGIDETNIKSTLALGDLMLETFLQEELIEIFREYEGRRAPYMVRITGDVDAVKPVLIGTSFVPLEPIKGLRSPLTKEPFIKGWHDAKKFHQYLDAPFVRALNALRSQAWKLNEPVLKVLMMNPPDTKLELVDDDGEIHILDLTKKWSDISNVKHMDGTPFLGQKDAKLQRMMSKMFEYNQVVAKATMVKENGGIFYQEVACDYRGRVYYAEPFLEFQGSDISRSLFLFADVKSVGTEGAFWLYVHAATSYNESFTVDQLRGLEWTTTDYVQYLKTEGLDTISVDKMTIQDRYNWTESNLSRFICQKTNTPVFQTNAEKPYAFLAVCLEILGYLSDTENYCSGLPIPIDGSNNGKNCLPL